MNWKQLLSTKVRQATLIEIHQLYRLHHFMERLQKEVAWFVEKNDYRNKDKDWGNSADSIQRGMQKCAGGYPADEVFRAKL